MQGKNQSNKIASHNREEAGRADDQRECLLFAAKIHQDASFIPLADDAV